MFLCFLPRAERILFVWKRPDLCLPELLDMDCFGFCFKSRESSRINSRKKYELLFLLKYMLFMSRGKL